MASQKDIKSRISSVKNIRKITRAMEMVAAARLRRAEQRIEELRPYAEAIRRMTRRAVEAAEKIPSLPLLEEHDSVDRVGLLLITGDRGLAGSFNSQIIRAGNRRMREIREEGASVVFYAGYISPMSQEVRHETLIPLQQADVLGDEEGDGEGEDGHDRDERSGGG